MARLIVGENDLGTINPELASQWHPTKNEGLSPHNVTLFSNKRVWWVCSMFHEWEVAISHRSNGSGCPICSGRRVLAGFNDLASINPELAAQWHPTMNGSRAPQDVMPFSGESAWWRCTKFHEWKAMIRDRSTGNGCPICSGNSVKAGFNDLATASQDLASQWHPTRNGTLTPKDVGPGSDKKVWWICTLLHEWEAVVNSRSNGRGCPTCSGKRVLIGFNDLATVDPQLATQWHPMKNGKLTSKNVTAGSKKIVWWICSLLHEWEAAVKNRTNGNGCPTCSGKRVFVGFNDLATINPKLTSQWHPTKNGKLSPQDLTQWSGKKVWWACEFRHEWLAVISSRSEGRGCANCSIGVTEKSFREAFEKLSNFEFESNRIDLIRFSRKSDRAQIDMLNDDLKLVIEYDGEWTHGASGPEGKTLEQKLAEDKETTQALVGIGYKVIRIREHSNKGKLPLVPLDPEYESNVFQITYKSFGKDKNDIGELVQKTIQEKEDWFLLQNISLS